MELSQLHTVLYITHLYYLGCKVADTYPLKLNFPFQAVMESKGSSEFGSQILISPVNCRYNLICTSHSTIVGVSGSQHREIITVFGLAVSKYIGVETIWTLLLLLIYKYPNPCIVDNILPSKPLYIKFKFEYPSVLNTILLFKDEVL